MICGQTEVTRDLIEAHYVTGAPIVYEAADVVPSDFNSAAPKVSYIENGSAHELTCDFIASCDGFHGISRRSAPQGAIETFERVYPFGWLGVLADVPPAAAELSTPLTLGFALCSMRSPTRSRFYVQAALDEGIEDLPDGRKPVPRALILPAAMCAISHKVWLNTTANLRALASPPIPAARSPASGRSSASRGL